MADTRQLERAMDRTAMKVALTMKHRLPPGAEPNGETRFRTHWDGVHFTNVEWFSPTHAKYWVRGWRQDWGLGDDGAFIELDAARCVADPPPHERVGPLEILRKEPLTPYIETFRNPSDKPLNVTLAFDHKDVWSSSVDIETTITAGFEAQFGSPESSPVSAKVWGEISTSIGVGMGLGTEDSVQPGIPELVIAPHCKRTVTRERHKTDARKEVSVTGRMTCGITSHDAYRHHWRWESYEDFLATVKGDAPRWWNLEHDLGANYSRRPVDAGWLKELEDRPVISYSTHMALQGASYGDTTAGADEPL